MRVQLLLIGKTDFDFVQQGLNEYCSRLKHYLPFDLEILPNIKNTKNLSPGQQKEKEGEMILKSVLPGDYLVLLDENGKEFTSVKFASYLEKKTYTVSRRLLFVIGGPYGFSPEVYDAAQEKIALSRMTFSHQLVRLIFAEQLYRAVTILNNEPYHHD
jgi:23S rRNA (pseudouridine1915-N3)-methyltransferase